MAVEGTIDGQDRRAWMRHRLAAGERLSLPDTARQFGVHEMTVRRDFQFLAESGLGRRIRGAILPSSAAPFDDRRNRASAAKRIIAAKLAGMITPGMAIGLDASTTVHALTAILPADQGLSVITNGLASFTALCRREGVRAYLSGGEQEDLNDCLVGTLAVQALTNFNLDLALISAAGISVRSGTSESTLAQAGMKLAMADTAERLVLAVDSGKFESTAPVKSLELARVDVLVTELDPGDGRLDRYRRLVAEIL